MAGRDGDALKVVKSKAGLQIEQMHAQWIARQLERFPEAHQFPRVEVQPFSAATKRQVSRCGPRHDNHQDL